MTKNETMLLKRIEELEARIRALEARPAYVPQPLMIPALPAAPPGTYCTGVVHFPPEPFPFKVTGGCASGFTGVITCMET